MSRSALVILLLVILTGCAHATPVSPTPATVVIIPQTQTAAPTPLPTSTPVVVTPTTVVTSQVTPTKPEKITYVIQPGDTLISIAEKFDVDVHALAVFNHIANINYIVAGYALVIPEPGYVPPPPAPTILVGKQIVVELSSQKVFVYENGILIATFIVSTGLPDTPTVTGDYTILSKYEFYHMKGPGYDLPKVPWVMYFYQGYSFHGTYWHHNFGFPMSRGCVNMQTDDAKWLYDWAPIGTAVHIIN